MKPYRIIKVLALLAGCLELAAAEPIDAPTDGATVSGEFVNEASGVAATIPGGDSNNADGDYSFAAGHRARANHFEDFEYQSTGAKSRQLHGP